MHTENPWTVLRKTEPFACPYFTVRSDLVSHLGGRPLTYSSVRTKVFGVCVVPIDEHGQTTLVGQYRYVTDQYSWEVPGGGARLDRPWIDSAREELSEETGYKASQWLQIIDASVAPGTSDSFLKGYVAWDPCDGDAHPEPEENLSLRQIAFSKALAMVQSGEINHLATIAMLLNLQAKLSGGALPPDLARLLA